jgi:hypothetical protein
MIGAALRSLLVTAGTIEPIVGVDGLGKVKIYPIKVPQGVPYPAIVYQLISDVPIRCKAPGGATADEYRCQVSAYGKEYILIEQLAAAIRTALDDYKGTSEGETLLKIYFDGQRDLFEEEPKLFHRAMDFRVFVHNN